MPNFPFFFSTGTVSLGSKEIPAPVSQHEGDSLHTRVAPLRACGPYLVPSLVNSGTMSSVDASTGLCLGACFVPSHYPESRRCSCSWQQHKDKWHSHKLLGQPIKPQGHHGPSPHLPQGFGVIQSRSYFAEPHAHTKHTHTPRSAALKL